MAGGKVRARAGAWQLDFSIGKRRFREQIQANTLREAKMRLAERMVEESRKVGVRLDVPAAEMHLGEALTAWVKESAPPQTDRRRVKRFVDWAGESRFLERIDTKDVTTWTHFRAESVASTTARRELAAVSSLFSWAIRRGLISSNPVRNAPKPSGKYEPPPPISRDEVGAVLAAVRGHKILEPAYLLALFAGLRRAEIAAARWEDVDLQTSTILVQRGKTAGARAHLPLIDPLKKWIVENHKSAGPIVAGRSKKGVRPNAIHLAIIRWNAEREDGVVELPNIHRCRHTAATLLIRAGVPIHVVARFMRHTSTKMIENVYGHYGAVEFRDVLQEGLRHG